MGLLETQEKSDSYMSYLPALLTLPPTPDLSSPGLGFCLSSPSFSSLYDHSYFGYLFSWSLGFWLVLTLPDASRCSLPHIYNKPFPQPYLGAVTSSLFILRPYVLEPQPTQGRCSKNLSFIPLQAHPYPEPGASSPQRLTLVSKDPVLPSVTSASANQRIV